MGNKEAAQYVKDVLTKALVEVLGVAEEEEVEIGSTELFNFFNEEGSEIGWELSNGTWDERQAKSRKFTQYLEDNHNYASVECDGGGEGEGEYCYGIIRLDDKFFKAEWSYYSYNGCEYDDIEETIKEVKAVQKFVTVYE